MLDSSRHSIQRKPERTEEPPGGVRSLPDPGIAYDEAMSLLNQYMSRQISLNDFWWLLGFDFRDRRGHDRRQHDLYSGREGTQYLVWQGGKTAHIWIDGDTACRSYANGAIAKGRRKSFEVIGTPDGRDVCKNCMGKIGASVEKKVAK